MKQEIRKKLKKIAPLKILVVSCCAIKNKYSFFKKISFLISFFKDYRKYKKINKNENFDLKTEDLFPRIYDKSSTTPLDPVYFLQNNWCAKKIFENKPEKHFDIGSDAKFIGLISQFTPTTMIDIRPLVIEQENLSFIEGDILNLPFENNEIKSLSSLCVIEHIGLGRYGDTLDSLGSEKSIKEIKRVLAKEGNLYISVPIDNKNRTYFNAHRSFTRDYILELFEPLQLIEEKYIYGNNTQDNYQSEKGFGTGLYWFKK
ncbi:MAG: DUF268 domain-containing protein [Candidatus Pacebacteria bacterium]|nr:DUF268 domain-containing protein [Candidatus Paceibacterota bacterium]